MVAGSILPVAFHKNKLYFLFGKENELADTPGWSDFGGGVNKNETPYHTALREGSEELTGFLGDELLLKKNKIIHKILWNTYNVHIICIKYDENLPRYFNNNHDFLWNRINKQFLNKTKLFEKQQIKWFSIEDMKNQRNCFRTFYRNLVDILLNDSHIIYTKVQQLNKHTSKKYIKKNTFTKYNKSTSLKKKKYFKRSIQTKKVN